MPRAAVLAAALLGGALGARPQSAPPDLSGVYQPIPDDKTLPGGRKNSGSPNDIALKPPAAEQAKTVRLEDDPAKWCQPLGPFRMMARKENKIEIVPAPGMVVILHEDIAHGSMRPIYLDRKHRFTQLLWQGETVGRWEGETLVAETVGFNERTWLNDKGAQHTEDLRLVERIRPIENGQYLEYRVTAEDPTVLAEPATYTRYFEKVDAEVLEDICYIEGVDPTSPESFQPGR